MSEKIIISQLRFPQLELLNKMFTRASREEYVVREDFCY